jgi:hypothetical protein
MLPCRHAGKVMRKIQQSRNLPQPCLIVRHAAECTP